MRRRPISFTGIMILFFMAAALMFSGCSGVTVTAPDPEVTGIILYEAGYDLAAIALADQPERRIERAEFAIGAALAMLEEEKDLGKVISGIADFVETYDVGDEAKVEQWKPVAISAVRILKSFIELDLDIPEKYTLAFMYTKSFLEGAQEGVKSLS